MATANTWRQMHCGVPMFSHVQVPMFSTAMFSEASTRLLLHDPKQQNLFRFAVLSLVSSLAMHSQKQYSLEKVPVREYTKVLQKLSSLVQPYKGYMFSMVQTQTYIMSVTAKKKQLTPATARITKTWCKPKTSTKNNLICTATPHLMLQVTCLM